MNDRIELITNELDDKKATDIQVFDMKNSDYFVDYVVVATSMGERHSLALLEYLKTALKAKGEQFLNIEATGDWIVVDLGDTLIHLLSPDFRVKYNLEEFLQQTQKKQ
ncbi:MAG: ribosome silencing factor [Campylobacteraceae bacterium]|jgi:nicotinate-nucleotide adenylyltransferase|nr:ribosome silencing factor [Campylobacteraceae bacterium]